MTFSAISKKKSIVGMGKGTSHIILKNTHKHQKKVHQHFMFLNSPQTTEFYPGHRHQNIVAGRYFT